MRFPQRLISIAIVYEKPTTVTGFLMYLAVYRRLWQIVAVKLTRPGAAGFTGNSAGLSPPRASDFETTPSSTRTPLSGRVIENEHPVGPGHLSQLVLLSV
jgi:hypothetical protein